MTLFFFLMLLSTTDTKQGVECKEGQHCSECDMEGYCLQGCDKGFFGMKCSSKCNSRCRYSICKLDPGTGAGKCTAGCVTGYQGTSCDRPCDSHVVNCTMCAGGCDEGHCQLGDACFVGCRDSMYGSGCKTCPSGCGTCNRMTGVCDECDQTHYGVNCEKTCEHCAGSCEADCQCIPGFYGDYCAETCSKTCRPKSALKCLPAVTSDNCTGECDKHNATCLHGCVDGWFGPRCFSQCNPGCRHQRCNAAGSCAEGCQLHHFGSACEPCPENCANRTCDQTTGACVKYWNVSEERIEPNCTQACSPTPDRSTANRNTSLQGVPHTNSATLIWSVCAAILFALLASGVCCVCFCKGPCVQKDVTDANREGVQMHLGSPRISSHDYCDVDEGEGGPVIVFL